MELEKKENEKQFIFFQNKRAEINNSGLNEKFLNTKRPITLNKIQFPKESIYCIKKDIPKPVKDPEKIIKILEKK